MAAFQARIDAYRSQNVQVLGVTYQTDKIGPMESWAAEKKISYPILSVTKEELSSLCLFNEAENSSAKAVALFSRGNLIYAQQVSNPRIPRKLLPLSEACLME